MTKEVESLVLYPMLRTTVEHMLEMTKYRLADYKTIDGRKVRGMIAYLQGEIEAYENVLSLIDIIERAVGDSLGRLDEREKEEKEIVNIYIGFSFDGDNYIPLIATTDFDRCKNHLLKMVEIGDDDYTYWMEVWSNEKRIRELFYDANEKRFVDTTDF